MIGFSEPGPLGLILTGISALTSVTQCKPLPLTGFTKALYPYEDITTILSSAIDIKSFNSKNW